MYLSFSQHTSSYNGFSIPLTLAATLNLDDFDAILEVISEGFAKLLLNRLRLIFFVQFFPVLHKSHGDRKHNQQGEIHNSIPL